MCPNYTSSGLTNIGNILPQVWWQSNTPLLKTVTVMVVVVGAQKKDRFHLLRDLWEIMGGRLCPSFLEKKISVRSSYRVLLSTVPSPKKTQRTKKYNNIGFSSLPLPTLLKDSLMAWHSTWSARQCVYIWSDNLQLLYTSKLEVIWDQTASDLLMYKLRPPYKYDHWEFASFQARHLGKHLASLERTTTDSTDRKT